MTPDEAARILGIAVGSGPEAVQRAYRLLARSSHPDGGGVEDNFIRLTAARDALLAVPPAVTMAPPPPAPPAPRSWPLFATWTGLLALAIFLCAYLAPLPFTIAEPLVRFPLLVVGLLGYALTGRRFLLVLALIALAATAIIGVIFTTLGVLVGLLLMVAAVFGLITMGQTEARFRRARATIPVWRS